jgi:hypothetical protein
MKQAIRRLSPRLLHLLDPLLLQRPDMSSELIGLTIFSSTNTPEDNKKRTDGKAAGF